MIKCKFKLFIIFVFLFVCCVNFQVQAKEISIEDLQVNSKLFKDGSLDVEEIINFRVDGEVNSVHRSIELNEASDIENISVSQITTSDEKKFKRVDKVENEENGVYEITKKDKTYNLKIYSAFKNEKKILKIKYKLVGVGVKYKDIGVLCYRFERESNKTQIDKFNMNLSIPNGAQSKDLKVLIDKPLYNSRSFIIDKNNFNVKSENIQEKIPIEIRYIFPNKVMPFTSNVKNQNISHRVIGEENRIKKALEYEGNKQQFMNKMGKFSGFIFVVLDMGLIFFIFKKKKRKVGKFNFDLFPDDCEPALVSRLCIGNLKEKDLVVCILNLVRKNYLTFQKEEDGEYTIIKNKEDDQYILKYEEFLINWFIRRIGNGFKVTSYEIKYYINNNKEFFKEFNSWKYLVEQEFEDKNYFDRFSAIIGKVVISICIFQIVASVVFLFKGNYFHYINIIISLLMIIFAVPLFGRKNDYGYSETLKWNRFKKYIENDEIKEDIFENINQMDKCFIYALSLDVNEKMLRKINSKLKGKLSQCYKNSCFYWYYNLDMCFNSNMSEGDVSTSYTNKPSSKNKRLYSEFGKNN